MMKDPTTVSQDDKQALAQTIVDKAQQDAGRDQRQRVGEPQLRVEVLRVERRLVHRAGDLHDHAVASPSRRKVGDVTRTRNYPGVADDGRLGSRRETRDAREGRADRGRSGRDVHGEAARLERPEGSRS